MASGVRSRYSPKTGLVYIPANEIAQPYLAEKDWKASAIGMQLGLDTASVAMPADAKTRAAAKAATTGKLLAWDPVTQTEKWSVPYPGPWNGGVLSTAGNLVFQGGITISRGHSGDSPARSALLSPLPPGPSSDSRGSRGS